MFKKVNEKLKDEFFTQHRTNTETLTSILEHFNLQLRKDYQDELDRDSFSLIGLKDDILGGNTKVTYD
jgi:hypothetical protein